MNARYHQPNGGKLRHNSRPATITTPNCGSRSTTAWPNTCARDRAFRGVRGIPRRIRGVVVDRGKHFGVVAGGGPIHVDG